MNVDPDEWEDLGPAEKFRTQPLTEVRVRGQKIAF